MSAALQFLIVDDQDDILLLILEKILGTFKSTITIAKSGHDAIQALEQGNKFDLIICDFQMPNGDGKLVFDYTRKLSSPVPFILYTAASQLPDFEGSNFLGVVAKEDHNKIIQLIKSWIDKR